MVAMGSFFFVFIRRGIKISSEDGGCTLYEPVVPCVACYRECNLVAGGFHELS